MQVRGSVCAYVCVCAHVHKCVDMDTVCIHMGCGGIVVRTSDSQSKELRFESSCCRLEVLIILFTPRYFCSLHVTSVHATLLLFTPRYFCSLHVTSVHSTLLLFTPRYFCSHHVTSVHSTLLLFTPRYFCSHHVTSVHSTLLLFTQLSK